MQEPALCAAWSPWFSFRLSWIKTLQIWFFVSSFWHFPSLYSPDCSTWKYLHCSWVHWELLYPLGIHADLIWGLFPFSWLSVLDFFESLWQPIYLEAKEYAVLDCAHKHAGIRRIFYRRRINSPFCTRPACFFLCGYRTAAVCRICVGLHCLWNSELSHDLGNCACELISWRTAFNCSRHCHCDTISVLDMWTYMIENSVAQTTRVSLQLIRMIWKHAIFSMKLWWQLVT